MASNREFEIPRTPQAARLAREAFAPVLESCPAAVAADAILIVSELVTNVVRHTRSGVGTATVRLDDAGVWISVADGDAERPAVPVSLPAPDAVGGRGLSIVSQLAELQMDASSRGKVITATIRFAARKDGVRS